MRQRDYYFDNAKFMLIYFVVFGHLIQSFTNQSIWFDQIYKWIYSFHMPAFILISGYFAKGFYKPGYVVNLIKKLLVPYSLFQVTYSIYYYFLYDQNSLTFDPFVPHWSLWFLISLFFWNLLLFCFTKLNRLPALLIAVLFGLGIGYAEGVSTILSLSRTFVFFPVFLIGYYMKKEHFLRLKRPSIQLIAITLFIAFFIGYKQIPSLDNQWLLGSKSYLDLKIQLTYAPFIRLVFYTISGLMVLAFFSLVPSKRYFFTTIGTNSIYVYLLHGFIIRAFREVKGDIRLDFTTGLSFITLLSLMITLLLSSKWFISIAQPLIELKFTRLKQASQNSIQFLLTSAFSILLSWRKYDRID